MIYLRVLDREAAAHPWYDCLAQKSAYVIRLQARWRAHTAMRRYRARQSAVLAREVFYRRAGACHHVLWLARRARVVLTPWRAHAAANGRYHANSVAAISANIPEAFARRAADRFRLTPRTEVSDMAQAASLGAKSGCANTSGVRDANATRGLRLTPSPELESELHPCQADETATTTTTRR